MIKIFFHYSDWITLWFILYKLNIVNYNPKFSILIALIQAPFFFISNMSKEKKDIQKLIGGFCYFSLKIIMFYCLIDTKIDIPNIIANIIVLLIYNIWVYKIHNVVYYKKIFDVSNANDNQDKIDYINEINKKKLKELNKYYNDELNEINKKYKYKLIKSCNKFNENKLDLINTKFKNKFNKLCTKFEEKY